MGNFLTTALNAIPGRTSDQAAHEDLLSDSFVAPFVEALKTSRSEPIIPGAAEIKTGRPYVRRRTPEFTPYIDGWVEVHRARLQLIAGGRPRCRGASLARSGRPADAQRGDPAADRNQHQVSVG